MLLFPLMITELTRLKNICGKKYLRAANIFYCKKLGKKNIKMEKWENGNLKKIEKMKNGKMEH